MEKYNSVLHNIDVEIAKANNDLRLLIEKSKEGSDWSAEFVERRSDWFKNRMTSLRGFKRDLKNTSKDDEIALFVIEQMIDDLPEFEWE